MANSLRQKMPGLFKRALDSLFQVKHAQISLPTEFHGSHYGGWHLCPTSITESTLVYSFGIGEDISFDLSIIDRFGASVYGFDPTPRSAEWIKAQKTPLNFQFLDYGVADFDGSAKFYPPPDASHVSHTMIANDWNRRIFIEVPVYRLKTIMHRLGHTRVDILKMDIEGAEYGVIADLLRSRIAPQQLLVEFHDRFVNSGRLKTWRAIWDLNRAGYRIFAVSQRGEEYSFMRLR